MNKKKEIKKTRKKSIKDTEYAKRKGQNDKNKKHRNGTIKN